MKLAALVETLKTRVIAADSFIDLNRFSPVPERGGSTGDTGRVSHEVTPSGVILHFQDGTKVVCQFTVVRP